MPFEILHSSPALPILYSFRRCPYAMRARLALAVSGQAYELREVLLRDKPPELIAASAKASVPVLILSTGQVIDESLSVMLWALQQYDPQQWLTPAAGDMVNMRELIEHNDGEFKRQLDRYKYPHRFAQDAEIAGKNLSQFASHNRDQAAVCLTVLNQRLEQYEWLFGAQASLADMALLPFIRQYAHTDAAWYAEQPWQALSAWLAAWEASELFAAVMQKYPRWSHESSPVTVGNGR